MDDVTNTLNCIHPTCFARMALIVAGSECGLASTFEMTGMRGVLISVLLRASCNFATAGCMYSVWKAPATARRTVILSQGKDQRQCKNCILMVAPCIHYKPRPAELPGLASSRHDVAA